jgi:hypothetical protein
MSEKIMEVVKEFAKKGYIVIVVETTRDSEVYYNYKTWRLYIVYKPIAVSYEEPRVRDVKVIPITTGAFQEYDSWDIKISMDELEKESYTVHKINIF